METKHFTCVEWLLEYQKEVEMIRAHSNYLTVLCISACIEFMGKLLSTDPIDCANNSSKKFEKALDTFPTLNKYAGKDLYHLLRCGLLHRISVKDDLLLSSEEPQQLDDKVVLNVNDFYDDFTLAVKAAQLRKEWENPKAQESYVSVIDHTTTSSTITCAATITK